MEMRKIKNKHAKQLSGLTIGNPKKEKGEKRGKWGKGKGGKGKGGK